MAYKEVKQDVEFWQPTTEGEEIEGDVVAVYPDAQFGVQVDIKNLADGKIWRTPSHKVLQNRLVAATVAPRDRIKIVFDGESESKKPGMSATKMYSLFVDVPEEKPTAKKPASKK